MEKGAPGEEAALKWKWPGQTGHLFLSGANKPPTSSHIVAMKDMNVKGVKHMKLSERLRLFRQRMAHAWQTVRGQAVTALEDMPAINLKNPDLAAIHAKAKEHMTSILRDDALEQELVDQIIDETQQQCAELDESMRGNNGHDRGEGDSYDKTT